MRRAGLFVLIILAAILIMALGGGRDEGDYLSEKIADAAQQMTLSNDDEAIVHYAPRSGLDQDYWVAVGAGPRCPNGDCEALRQSWLTVHTEGSDSGVSRSYQRFVAVPRPLKVMKHGAGVDIILRKIGDEIQLVDLR